MPRWATTRSSSPRIRAREVFVQRHLHRSAYRVRGFCHEQKAHRQNRYEIAAKIFDVRSCLNFYRESYLVQPPLLLQFNVHNSFKT